MQQEIQSFTGWGSLSHTLLEGIVTGNSIMGYLRSTTDNFMQVLTGHDFGPVIDASNERYWREHGGQESWRQMLRDSYASAPIKRTVSQAIKIINELIKLQGCKPAKIFIETTRSDGVKGKRTTSRHERLKQLYAAIKKDNREVWNELHDEGMTNQRLQSKALYLYFTQAGRCLYSGESIDIADVSNRDRYDIDHIIPQSLLKDDSFNNLVLVRRDRNARKTNEHVVPADMRQLRLWKHLRESGLMSDEKYRRLTRTTPFTESELAGFIERQLVETSQSTKVLSDILRSLYEEPGACRLVFQKAGLTSEFRRPMTHPEDRRLPQSEQRIIKPEFVKCRELNNLHHAKDAYLTVVCGNVYESVFSANPKTWVQRNKHKLGHTEFHMDRFMAYPHKDSNGSLVWSLDEHLQTVIHTMQRNDILQTVRTFEQTGGFFDQNVVPEAKAKVARKAREGDPMSSTRYGGMSGVRNAFFALIEANNGKRRIVPVPILHRDTPREYLLEAYSDAQVVIDRINYKSLVEVDGFPVTLDGTSGSSIVVTNQRALLLSEAEASYLKKVLKTYERLSARGSTYTIDSYSGITAEANLELFDCLLRKLRTGYAKRPAVATATQLLTAPDSRTTFQSMSAAEQVEQIARILPLFQPNPFASSYADLRALGGKQRMGNTSIAAGVSGSMILIHQSPTGIYERRVDLAR